MKQSATLEIEIQNNSTWNVAMIEDWLKGQKIKCKVTAVFVPLKRRGKLICVEGERRDG